MQRELGQVLGGKYRLIRLLGSGGMGSVWHAEHLTLSSPVALKLIDPATAKEPDALQRFLREARTAAALRSPHVVQILDYGVDGDTPYIAMELLDGESLAERLAREGRLGIRETARVIQHVARAIGRAHDAGIVHRDLKPENVFIVKNDDEELVKVLDFGIVKANPATLSDASALAATRTGTVLGTPYFMSPEQAEGAKTLDHRTDIWALGVIAYRCLLGQLPFMGDVVGKLILAICSRPLPVPSQLGPVPDGFDAWFARACARDLDARFSSAKQAAAEFSRLGEGQLAPSSIEPPPPSESGPSPLGATTGHSTNSEMASRSRRVSRTRYGLALLAALALVGGGLALRGWLAPATGEARPAASAAQPAASAEHEPPAEPHMAAPTLRALEPVEVAPQVPSIAAPAAPIPTPTTTPAGADPRPAAPSTKTTAPVRKAPPVSKPSAPAPAPAKPIVDLGI